MFENPKIYQIRKKLLDENILFTETERNGYVVFYIKSKLSYHVRLLEKLLDGLFDYMTMDSIGIEIGLKKEVNDCVKTKDMFKNQEKYIKRLKEKELLDGKWETDTTLRNDEMFLDEILSSKNRVSDYDIKFGGEDISKEEINEKFKELFKEFNEAVDCWNGVSNEEESTSKPKQYQIGIDTFERMKSNATKEEIIGFCKGNIDKYIWRKKGSDLEDLKKAKDYIDLWINTI